MQYCYSNALISLFEAIEPSNWLYHAVCDAWPVRGQTYGYLPSRRTLQLLLPVLISNPAEGRRLSWPE